MAVGFGLAFSSCLASASEPDLVPGGAYTDVALREIDGARESVQLYLYLFARYPTQPRSGPSRLLGSLLRARQRGLRVEVLLDPGGQAFDLLDRNGPVAEALRQGGVEVSYAEGPVLHAKVLVVDGKTVLLGSTNWSTAALEKNIEADVLIRSTSVAQTLLARMADVRRRPPPDLFPGGVVSVPAGLLFPPDKLGEIVRRKDDRALDLYLHFLRLGVSTSSFAPVDVPGAVGVLGARDEGPVANRRRLHRVFRRLRDFYGLLEVREVYGEDPTVRRVALSTTGVVGLPVAYFDYGWDRRLSLPGKIFLLLHLHYSAVSPITPRWSFGRRTLARRHGLTPDTLSLGVVELRRANLVEVEYDDQPTPADPHRHANTYTPAPFYAPEDLQKRFQALEKQYGAPALARARAVAQLLYEDSDATIVEKSIALETRYGREIMDQALHLLGKKNPDNPKRRFGYLVGVVQGLAGPPQAP